MILTNLDFAKSWQLLFQDPATPMMEGILYLHHNIFFFLLLILFLVLEDYFPTVMYLNEQPKKNNSWIFLLFINGQPLIINCIALVCILFYMIYNYKSIINYLKGFRKNTILSDISNVILFCLLLLMFYKGFVDPRNINNIILMLFSGLLVFFQFIYYNHLVFFLKKLSFSSLVTLLVLFTLVFMKVAKLLNMHLLYEHKVLACTIAAIFSFALIRLLFIDWLHLGRSVMDININIFCISYGIIFRLFFFEKIIELKYLAKVIANIPIVMFYILIVRFIYKLVLKWVFSSRLIYKENNVTQISNFLKNYYYYSFKLFFYSKELDKRRIIASIVYSIIIYCLVNMIDIHIYHNLLLLLVFINFYVRFNVAAILQNKWLFLGVQEKIEEKLPSNHIYMMKSMKEAFVEHLRTVAEAGSPPGAPGAGFDTGVVGGSTSGPRGGNPYGQQQPKPPYSCDEKLPEVNSNEQKGEGETKRETGGSDMLGPAVLTGIAVGEYILHSNDKQQEKLEDIVRDSYDKSLEQQQKSGEFQRGELEHTYAASKATTAAESKYHTDTAASFRQDKEAANSAAAKYKSSGDEAAAELAGVRQNGLDDIIGPPADFIL